MLEVMHIQGGKPLKGSIHVSGSKNAALPIFAAALLTEEPCRIENVPDLSDIRFMAQILEHLGASVEKVDASTWVIQAKNLSSKAPYDLVRKMRASICVLGPLMARLRKAEISLPGGCVIGQRPIDLHLKGLTKLGCTIEIRNGYVHVDGKSMQGTYVFLGGRQGSTVLGTANLLMVATLTPGITHIESAACEPEIVDLCRMLITMGAKIEGIGSPSLTIEGVSALSGCTHSVIGDRIEAGTYLVGAIMTRGDVTLEGASVSHLGSLVDKFDEARIPFEILGPKKIRVNATNAPELKPIDLITLPHPGFPTDLQAQMCALMAITPGLSVITERIYPNRFMHVPELQRMGANISIEGSTAIVHGRSRLSGAPVMASDLRASAALVLAGLAAEGETWIQRIYHLDRGYEHLDDKFRALGGQIQRLPADQMPLEIQDN